MFRPFRGFLRSIHPALGGAVWVGRFALIWAGLLGPGRLIAGDVTSTAREAASWGGLPQVADEICVTRLLARGLAAWRQLLARWPIWRRPASAIVAQVIAPSDFGDATRELWRIRFALLRGVNRRGLAAVAGQRGRYGKLAFAIDGK